MKNDRLAPYLPARFRWTVVLALCLFFCGCARELLEEYEERGGSSESKVREIRTARPLAGAHYYVWFPSRFRGYLREHLIPSQEPMLGEYSSSSPSVAAQHIAWANEAGIDFFTLDWWPGHDEQNARIDSGFLGAPNIGSSKFCIFYETWNLGYDQRTGATRLERPQVEKFIADMTEISRKYFGHPSYLRVNGRPVIILYLTRTLVGNVAGAISAFRALSSFQGHNPYIIGDEIFWDVVPADALPQSGPVATDQPQLSRIKLFDAITAYNLYESARPAHGGYGSQSTFISESYQLFQRYKQAVGNQVAVIPNLMPGYNDRGVRPDVNHYVIPRQWSPGAGPTSFLSEMMDRFTIPLIDPKLPMLFITSWNEWSEDTAIEPTISMPETATDSSSSGSFYTQGYPYHGHGTAYLETLRSKLGPRSDLR